MYLLQEILLDFLTPNFHRITNNCSSSNSYFYRIPKLWNAFPKIDLPLSLYTKNEIPFYGIILCIILTLTIIVLYVLPASVTIATVTLLHLNLVL